MFQVSNINYLIYCFLVFMHNYFVFNKMLLSIWLCCSYYVGIRYHFPSLMKGFAPKLEGIAQLGLGHSYSRAKVKFNVNKVDNMIIHSVSLLDQLDKDLNTYSMRIR